MGDLRINVGSDNVTHYYDSTGAEVFPCRCGETHRGDYAAEARAHHECYHDAFVLLEPDQLTCAYCGKVAELLVVETV